MYVTLTHTAATQSIVYIHVGGWQWKVNPDSHYLITHHQSRKNSISPHHIFVQLAQVLVTEITSPCDLVFHKCCFNRSLPQSAVAGLTISNWKKEIENKHLSNKIILYWPQVHQQKSIKCHWWGSHLLKVWTKRTAFTCSIFLKARDSGKCQSKRIY